MLRQIREVFRPDAKYRQYLISVLVFGLAYGLYKGIFDNYLAEVVAMTEFDKGVNEFFRELPGFLLVFILALLYRFSAERIYKLGALIMLGGMALQTVIPANRIFVTIAVCIFSLGDHMQQGTRNTLSLHYARKGHGGAGLGIQQAIYESGKLAGYLLVAAIFVLAGSSIGLFRSIFGVSAGIIGVGFLASLAMTDNSETDRAKRHFNFRRKFAKYYMLEVFYGARKQVFFTFGPYVLVLFYGAGPTTISLLFAISSVSCFFASPLVGKIIDRIGYKIVMISDTLILVIVCFFYGFAHRIFPMPIAFTVCCVNYVLDSVISLASMASSVYVQDLSDNTDEMKTTISTGLSVNHFITILIALFGGWIWQTLGMETLFMLSAVLGLCNSAYAATIRRPEYQR